MSDRDLDAEFARIVAGWDAEAPDPLPRAAVADVVTEGDAGAGADGATTGSPSSDEGARPDDPDSPQPTGPGSASSPNASTGPTGPSTPPSPASSSGLLELPIAPTTSHAWRGSTSRRDDADEMVNDDDHFVPPSDIDLPSAETDPMFWAIVGGLVGGPLLLLYVLFFDRDGSSWWVVTALTMVVVGFVLLVLRGGNEHDPFDDGTRV